MLLQGDTSLSNLKVPVTTAWLLGTCMEAKGKQDLWVQQRPEVLKALREQALVQSAESSNRIEGVIVAPERLRPILLGNARPMDRSEEELVGYRQALNWIFSRKRPPKLEPRLVRKLHEMAQGGFSGDAGKWKTRDNEIIEIAPDGKRTIRFVPTPAKKVPDTIERLCTAYREVSDSEHMPPLLAMATFVLDFLCVHPFRDGNGRVSRLLTTLLLQEHGFVVARYISLERLVEETKEDYYEVLRRCSKGWHEGKNEIVPWWNYLLGVVKRGYGEFERRMEKYGDVGKTDLVRAAIERLASPFSASEVKAQCPSVSAQLVKKVLADLKKEGRLRLKGRGRGARWEHA